MKSFSFLPPPCTEVSREKAMYEKTFEVTFVDFFSSGYFGLGHGQHEKR